MTENSIEKETEKEINLISIDEALYDKAGKLLEELRASGLRIAFAESCTGGMLAAALTAHPGASDVLEMSFVTYCDRAKNLLVNVPDDVLAKFTAVSAHTAAAMAAGALLQSGADIAVSVTGLAGPGGGTESRPVGLVYIGVAGMGETMAYRCYFAGDRDMVRMQAALTAIRLAGKRVTDGVGVN